MFWLRIGSSDPHEYYRANIALLRATQASLYASAMLLATSPILALRDPATHMRLMPLGLVAFYFAVMYAQIPGFTGRMPSRALTAANAATLALGSALWMLRVPYAFAPHAAAQAIAWLPGLGTTPLRIPNLIVFAGLAALAAADDPDELVAYPVASALSLVARIDASTRGRPVSKAVAAPIAALVLVPVFHGYAYAASAALSLATSLPNPAKRPVYAAASMMGRALMLAAPLHSHSTYMGIAIIMSGLCVPWLVPGILLRESPGNRIGLVALAAAAAALRLTNHLAPSAATVAVIVAYSALLILSRRAYKLEPPPR